MPVLAAASLNLQPINLQFVQKLAILQLYKIFLFHWWYDGGVTKVQLVVYFCTLLYFLILIYYSFTIILNICNGWIFFGELFDDRKDVELSLEQQNSAALVAYVKMGEE